MKQTKKITIMGVPYTVKVVKRVSREETLRGQINHLTAEIRLNRDMPSGLMNQTLTHEIMHGILDHLGYDDLCVDEKFVQAMASAVYDVFGAQDVFFREE